MALAEKNEMGISTIVGDVLANFWNALPVKKVHSYQQGVKFSWGRDVKLLSAGIYAHWPFFQSIEVEDTVLQVIDTPYQALMTKDREPIILSSSIAYKIENARKYWTSLQDQDESIVNLTKGIVGTEVRNRSLESLCASPIEFEQEVLTALIKKTDPWGIEMENFYLADLVKAPSLRLLGEKV